MTHEVSMQGVAWTARLMRVITYIRTALLAEQRLDGGIDIQYPRSVQGGLYAGEKLRSKPVPALVRTHPCQRPAQRVLADDLAHTKHLRTDAVTAQAGDMRVAMVPSENRQEPGAEDVSLVGGVAAVIGQGTTVHPGLVHACGSKRLCKKSQLRIRRRAGFVIPADMDAPSRRLHVKRLQLGTVDGNLCLRQLTHRVTPLMTMKSAPSLPFDTFSIVLLPERGS
jgi:hypothetical protein